jgi:hypothetical protein
VFDLVDDQASGHRFDLARKPSPVRPRISIRVAVYHVYNVSIILLDSQDEQEIS